MDFPDYHSTDLEPPSVDLDLYLAACQSLLASSESTELIAGIAAATGRDYREILSFSWLGTTETGDFNRLTLQPHPYLLHFSASREPFRHIDILSIVPAANVLAAIHKLRREEDIVRLEGMAFHEQAFQFLRHQVDKCVYTTLSEFIQVLPKGDHLKEIYRAIAIHFFCPQSEEPDFCRSYLEHLGSAHNSNYRLTRNHASLTQQGVMISIAPLRIDRKSTADNEEVAQEWDALSLAEVTELVRTKLAEPHPAAKSGQDRELIRVLLGFVEQQSQLIKMLLADRFQAPSQESSQPQLPDDLSIVYRRAIRTWELTQQWNREHNYHPEMAIQLSKSLLARSFGIHARAIQQFWSNHETAIEAENQRLGLNSSGSYFNKGGKLEQYVTHVKSILGEEGFYN